MINITMKSKGALDRSTISSINASSGRGAITSQNIGTLNQQMVPGSTPQPAPRPNQQPTGQQAVPAQTHTPPQQQAPVQTQTLTQQKAPAQRQLPPLVKPVQKGQKIALETAGPLKSVRACFGWNSTNTQCDVDVSAFLLGADGKVLGDSWFVFYGQTTSPDQSTEFHADNSVDCEMISINLQTLNPDVKKIVFVLTINEAFKNNLNFGMMKDAYVRILNEDGSELVSFQMTDYYSNVISMMIGEIYQHNGAWKFNAVGNGVAKDLSGLCSLYGVQVSD